jgi:hypothetical protein
MELPFALGAWRLGLAAPSPLPNGYNRIRKKSALKAAILRRSDRVREGARERGSHVSGKMRKGVSREPVAVNCEEAVWAGVRCWVVGALGALLRALCSLRFALCSSNGTGTPAPTSSEVGRITGARGRELGGAEP